MRAEGFGGILLSILVISLLAPSIDVGPLSASSNAIALPPTDDAEVRELSPDSNHGASAIMWVQSAKSERNRRAFMKFDLSSIPPGAVIVEAKLHLYCQLARFADLNVQVHAVDDDNWAERTITWNNQPPHGEVLDVVVVARGAGFRWYSWDVTDFVRAEFSGDGIASFCLRAEEENIRGSDGFRSKEHGIASTRPYLEVVYVLPVYGVAVSISPSSQSAPPGMTLSYVVAVANFGTVEDTYTLTATDNAGWAPTLSENSLTIPAGRTATVALSVRIPDDTFGGEGDNITVVATGTGVSNSASCIARAAVVRSVGVSISPGEASGAPGTTLSFEVVVKNLSNVDDAYALEATDALGWPLSLDDAVLTIPPGENRATTLHVTIPDNVAISTADSIEVKATSLENAEVSSSATCVAHAAVVRGVGVEISPSYQSGAPGETLSYTVRVANAGNVEDTYALSAEDDAGWPLVVSPTTLALAAGASGTATLSVVMPDNWLGCTEDNITVRAVGTGVENSATCVAHLAVVRGIEVSVSPSYQSGLPGEVLTYTVVIKNVGNVLENYVLLVSDSENWTPTLYPTWLVLWPEESGTATLSVALPEFVVDYVEDNIMVIATSLEDPTVSASDSCMAHPILRRARVSISPENQGGKPGSVLSYAVTVKNAGELEDNILLEVEDELGWHLELDDAWLVIPPDENGTTTLRVTIPIDVAGGVEDRVTVIAAPVGYPIGGDSAACVARVTVIYGVEVSISPSYQSGLPGAALNYAVEVKNTGTVEDNFSLEVTDDLGWQLWLENAWLVIPPGENRVTNLVVYIPENAQGCTEDNITVIATSLSDNAVFSEGSCIAHVEAVPFTLRLVKGWNMVSLPVLPQNQDPDAIFGGAYYVMYRWDAENRRYVLHADSGSLVEPDPSVEVGVGYWIFALENRDVGLVGIPVERLTLSLRMGWNMIGSTYRSLGIADPMDDPDGSVLGRSFTWDAAQRRYATTQLLGLGKGYWVYALNDCSLTLAPTRITMASISAQAMAQSWDAAIIAEFPQGSDDAIFGVRFDATIGFDSAHDMPEPPAPAEPPYVQAYFYYPANGPSLDKLHASYIALGSPMEWPLRISYRDNIENIVLRWAVENVPQRYSVLLFKGESRVADMRSVENYAFMAATGNHDFKVIVQLIPLTLLRPENRALMGENRPTFEWENAYVADNYEIWVDNDSDFSSPGVLENLRENFYTPATGLRDGSYWWRVRAYLGGETSGFSEGWTFTVDATPPSSSVDAISPYWRNDSPITITATASDATSGVARVALWYRFSSDNSSWGAWTLFENDNAAPWSWSFGFPSGNGYYEFYSTARDNAGNEESPPAIADARCGFDNVAPSKPTLTSPIGGGWVNDNTPLLSWAAASDGLSGVSYYEVQVDNDSGFGSPENTGTAISTSYTVGNELKEGAQYWRVRAVDKAGNVGAWENDWFRIDVTSPGKPTLVSPENKKLDNKLGQTFTWTRPEAGLTYHIQVDNESSFAPPHVRENSALADNYYTHTFTVDGAYYWRVRAKDAANNWGPWADNFKLTLDTAPPAKPTLVSPENNAVRSILSTTFTWTRPEPDVTYHIQIDSEASFTPPHVHENAAAGENLYAYEFASEGTYHWRVRVRDRAGNWGAWADNFKLTIQLPPGLPGKPSLVSPADGALTNDNTPTFEWTPGENADNHRLLVDNDSNFSSPVENRLLGAADNAYTPAIGYPDGSYFWRVVAINAAGENPSTIWQFTIDATPPAAPTLVWPANGENINDNAPNLDWGAVLDASPPVLYRVRVSDNAAFPYDNVDSGWIAADNFKLATQLREGVWYWRGQAKDNAGNVGENSATRSFRVDVTPPPTPALLEPAEGATTTDNTPTFRWAAVVDNSMPVTYRLQVDNDPDFSSPEVDVPRLLDNAFTPTAGLPFENYSWRVQARDNAGNLGAWSSVRTLLIVAARGVKVTISPSENSGPPGATLTYKVTVRNTGNVKDNYVLAVSDNMNWGPRLSDNRLDNVQPGENGTATLSITIPGGASHDARDNIVVVATSMENAELKDSASCIARAIVRGVSVAISPSSASGAPKQVLTYTVVVKNTGGVKDSYALSAADTLGWRPALSDNRLEDMQPGEERSAALSVTVPENASTGAEDNITVVATGTGVSASASCVARAAPLAGVNVEILPSDKSGPPGSRLTFRVLVKNVGKVDDVYALSVADAADWSPRVEPSTLDLAAGASGEAKLTVEVPRDAKQGDSITITVKVTSQVDPGVSESAQCRAIVGAAPLVILIPLAAAAILVGAAIFAVSYFRHRARAAKRIGVLREVAGLGGGAARDPRLSDGILRMSKNS